MKVIFNKRWEPQDKPTILGENEIFQKFQFKYMAEPPLKKSFQSCTEHLVKCTGGKVNTKLLNSIHVLDDPEESIAVHQTCKTMGHGLVALEFIRERTVICEYLGKIGLHGAPEDGEYRLCLEDPMTNSINPQTLFVNAKEEGNLARFACHFPDEQPSHLKCRVKLANINLERFPGSDGRNHFFYITKADIKRGEELGWDYGGYYTMGENPVYYNVETQKFIREKRQPANNHHDMKVENKEAGIKKGSGLSIKTASSANEYYYINGIDIAATGMLINENLGHWVTYDRKLQYSIEFGLGTVASYCGYKIGAKNYHLPMVRAVVFSIKDIVNNQFRFILSKEVRSILDGYEEEVDFGINIACNAVLSMITPCPQLTFAVMTLDSISKYLEVEQSDNYVYVAVGAAVGLLAAYTKGASTYYEYVGSAISSAYLVELSGKANEFRAYFFNKENPIYDDL
jgi:hypothetical protein